MPKGDSNGQMQKLAAVLAKGSRKNALSIIRSRLREPFKNPYQEIFWKGMERAIYRQESESLAFLLLSGLGRQEVRKYTKDLKAKKKEILIRDHTQTELSNHYIAYWISLLDAYYSVCSQ